MIYRMELECDVEFKSDDRGRELFADSCDVSGLFMFGRDWNEKQLRETFGDMGTEALLYLIHTNAWSEYND